MPLTVLQTNEQLGCRRCPNMSCNSTDWDLWWFCHPKMISLCSLLFLSGLLDSRSSVSPTDFSPADPCSSSPAATRKASHRAPDTFSPLSIFLILRCKNFQITESEHPCSHYLDSIIFLYYTLLDFVTYLTIINSSALIFFSKYQFCLFYDFI